MKKIVRDNLPIVTVREYQAIDMTRVFELTAVRDIKAGTEFVIDTENKGTWHVGKKLDDELIGKEIVG